MQRPYAYDHEYLVGRVELGHEVVVDGKSYRKVGDLPSQGELDKLLERDGMKPKELAPVDPLVPHGDPANEPIAAVVARDRERTIDARPRPDRTRTGRPEKG